MNIADSAATLDLGFSDYVVYVDESGDQGMVSIDPSFPMFALLFCMKRLLMFLLDKIIECKVFP